MTKLVLYCGVILLACCLNSAQSAWSQSFIGNAVNKDYPGMCFYNQTQTPINIGSIYKPSSECVQIYCREDYVLRLEYCPFYMPRDDCEVTVDEGAEYPGCCAKMTCPNEQP
ncbi:uncharacterized protein LOC129946774 [Eupeodes corollae]|uniref:uncharacterized protein LOC129946774 n=1 Tax=Eupeodes corollae TaxID=290404 RepID=UPI0024930F58|nr:uncharacterized protein LOC129946774 [Eupeodes corollae]